jgi:hypothetical protein
LGQTFSARLQDKIAPTLFIHFSNSKFHFCWDQIAEGNSILNTGRDAKVGYTTLENNGYKGGNSATSEVMNALDFSPGGISREVYL